MPEFLTTTELFIHILQLVLGTIWSTLMTIYYIFIEIYHLFFPPPGKSINGWHVLVTGAGRGLGREFAICFAKEGCQVTCIDIDINSCEETVKLINNSYPDKAQGYKLDVTNREDVNKFATKLEEDVGPLDILVNNAGIVQSNGLLAMSDVDIERMMNVNTMSHFWTIRAFLPNMQKRRRGHIVAVSSVAAITAAANIAPYTASKCAVSGLMVCLREELRRVKSEVKVTVVQPFFISPWNDVQHWDLKTVIPDITADLVAARAVEGIKQDRFNVTVPSYLYFTCSVIKMLPAKASDLWRDTFCATIEPLERR